MALKVGEAFHYFTLFSFGLRGFFLNRYIGEFNRCLPTMQCSYCSFQMSAISTDHAQSLSNLTFGRCIQK